VRELLDYDPESGIFTWKVTRCQKARRGDIAGTVTPDGYVVIHFDRKNHGAHRLAWFWMTGKWPVDMIDHINNQTSDNRWVNLREATNIQNLANSGRHKDNTSGFKGVKWHKQRSKWHVQIAYNGRRFSLGLFTNIEMAALAYAGAHRLIHGDFSHSTINVTINNYFSGANHD
jgi:hypothetical protein